MIQYVRQLELHKFFSENMPCRIKKRTSNGVNCDWVINSRMDLTTLGVHIYFTKNVSNRKRREKAVL